MFGRVRERNSHGKTKNTLNSTNGKQVAKANDSTRIFTGKKLNDKSQERPMLPPVFPASAQILKKKEYTINLD
jgi:hypothetical protein